MIPQVRSALRRLKQDPPSPPQCLLCEVFFMPDFVDSPSFLADIEARQDDVLRRLDQLDRDILGVLSQHGNPHGPAQQEGAGEADSGGLLGTIS